MTSKIQELTEIDVLKENIVIRFCEEFLASGAEIPAFKIIKKVLDILREIAFTKHMQLSKTVEILIVDKNNNKKNC